MTEILSGMKSKLTLKFIVFAVLNLKLNKCLNCQISRNELAHLTSTSICSWNFYSFFPFFNTDVKCVEIPEVVVLLKVVESKLGRVKNSTLGILS